MDATKANFFLQDLAAYRAGELDETAMIENLKYFLNDDENEMMISDEDFNDLRAAYDSFEAMLDYYEKVAKDIIKGGDGSSVSATPASAE